MIHINLLKKQCSEFVKLIKQETTGTFGGDKPAYTVDSEFTAVAIKNTSTQYIVAQREYAIGDYIITSITPISLVKGDIVRRESDNKTFEVDASTLDTGAPQFAGIKIKAQVNAKEVVL